MDTFEFGAATDENAVVWRPAESRVALVVDDEVFARLFAIQILLDEGFTVLEAGDAAEGLEVLYDNHDVSVLVTDINMPGDMDGLALVEMVREERPEIALIVTSGLKKPADIPSGARFLPKPYTAPELMTLIRELTPVSPSGADQ